ncbi:Mfa1 family fimbria major subunit [uncultured Alistipes sp.]|jgi:hypothetical protein bfra3_07627|uniref:Mfa1 family fimbria major subunit n=1 Tax=uncultured Alistipes sp. TaxID=538949 RepID=UPI0025D52394|nr:Mfa1 family fimbria major subunit [uncultured Alistipes sp.]
MKIKFKSLCVAALACVGMLAASCSNDDVQPNGPGGGDEGEAAYFSITVRGAAGMGGRATYDEGKAEEAYVNSIRVVLYSSAHIAAEVLDFDALHNGSQSFDGADLVAGSTAKKFTTIGKKVKKQDYQMLVILNPTQVIKDATEKGKTVASFNSAVTVNDVTLLTGGAANNSFVMTNWQGLVNVDKDTYILEKKEDAEAKPVPVNVERAVAKVMVVTPAVAPTPTDYEYTVQGWTLDVVNTKTTWMRTPWMSVAGGVISNTESDVVADRYQNYAKDPNVGDAANGVFHSYQAWLAAGSQGTAPAYENTDFIYTTSATSSTWPAASAANAATINSKYVVENTMEAAHQYRDVTTTVLLKAKFTPLKSALGAAMTASDPYYAFYTSSMRYVFLASELEAEYQWQQANATVENPTSTQYQDPQIQVFMEAIATYRGKVGEAFDTYAASATSAELQYDFAFFDADQVNYYRIPIRHYEDTEQPNVMQYGRFGVVRNNIYLLTVNDINGPGAVTVKPWPSTPPVDPPGPEEPEGPDEDEEGWISAEIQILDWVVRSHGINAGE